MATTSELLTANLHDVFGNSDPESRRAAIERTFAPDVAFARLRTILAEAQQS
ncbi:hypothetical protein EDF24_0868 [Curtobacterium sp. PhB130]|uniref:hypothetical protein n=1 Tax=Curtobacterium sp. PhB130 TaxID=2485178 RepID=UPI000F9FB183|nr:hypothetical protein [Curtobacterium sp. PhB130]ROS78098.1 hypothetical protein EDF24_0868 [Curtobacterium sp. PhB130]